MLDEPTTGLDLAARFGFLERVRAIAANGTTVVLVTHHLEEIIPEIERVVLIKDGRLAAHGPKQEILTAEALTMLFGLPVAVERSDGYHYARPASTVAG